MAHQLPDEYVARRFAELNPTNPFTSERAGVLFDGRMPSFTDPGGDYHVIVTATSATCSCKSWIHRKQDCTHINHIKEVLASG